MNIRREQPSDYADVYELVKISFAISFHADGTEADYLNELRKKDTFIPELSLVAENDESKLIGQIVLYKTNITTSERTITELLLSPICVHPNYFCRGVARTMMEESFRIAREMGYKSVFLCGNPDFYKKMGFKPTYEYDIYHIKDDSRRAEWCMVRELVSGALNSIDGTVNIQ